MATVRAGDQRVLMVVDVQDGVMAECWDAPRVVGQVGRAVGLARAAGVPVIWVQHEDEQLVPGGAAWQWAAPLAPAAGEACIRKRFNSSFEDTALEATLAGLGASHIVLAGAATNWCIRATAYAALERGYDLTLVEDAHSTGAVELAPGHSVLAPAIIDELNATLRWLRYPGRRSRVVPVEGLDFQGGGGPAAVPA